MLREIKEDLNKSVERPSAWSSRPAATKGVTLSSCCAGLRRSLSESQRTVSGVDRLISRFIWKCKGPRTDKNNPEKEES